MSSNLIRGLQDTSEANYAKFVPTMATTLGAGATNEADRWNTSNAANLAAGNLANSNYNSVNTQNLNAGQLSNNLYNTAMTQNNNNAATGINQMSADTGLADRSAKGLNNGVNTALGNNMPAVQYIQLQNGQMVPIKTGGN